MVVGQAEELASRLKLRGWKARPPLLGLQAQVVVLAGDRIREIWVNLAKGRTFETMHTMKPFSSML